MSSDEFKAAATNPEDVIGLLTLNVQAATSARSLRQATWLSERPATEVIVLTEVPATGNAHSAALADLGFACVCPRSTGDRRVLIAVRGGQIQSLPPLAPDWAHRLVSARVTIRGRDFNLIGIYVPSRGPRTARNVAKRAMQAAVAQALKEPNAHHPPFVLGDLNVVEPKHVPHHSVFGEWEYAFYRGFATAGYVDAFRLAHPESAEHSWFGHSGRGYRFDHAFVAEGLRAAVIACDYDQTTRSLGLSDHAALTLSVDFSKGGLMPSLLQLRDVDWSSGDDRGNRG